MRVVYWDLFAGTNPCPSGCCFDKFIVLPSLNRWFMSPKKKQKSTSLYIYICVDIHTYTCTYLHVHMCQPLGPCRLGCTSRRCCLKDSCSGQSPYVVPRLGCINAHGPLVPSIGVVMLTFLPLVRHRWAPLWRKIK